MKKLYLSLMFLIFAIPKIYSQTTETFESIQTGISSFSSNGKTFVLTSSTTYGFVTASPAGNYGYNGSAKYIQVNDGLNQETMGQTGIISCSSGNFKINNFWIYVSGNSAQNPGVTFNSAPGSITFRGKLAGSTVFTVVRNTSGANTGTSLPGNGFTYVNFANEGGSDNTNQVIDQLEIQLSSNYDYFAIDNFTFSNGVTTPTVTTNTPVSDYGAITAALGGNNDNGGDTSIADRGIVWSLTTNPVINGAGVTRLSTAVTNGTGAFTVNTTGLPPGTIIYYRAYAQNSVGFGYGNTVSFLTNAALSATQSQTAACNGANNATATVTPSGGKPPYNYTWSNGATGATATGLAPNNYSVLITDNEGTSITKNFVTVQNTVISGTTNITNVSCNGGNNGAIDLTPTGGTGTYTYNWGGGITTQDRTGLVAGTYSVTITDSNNCSATINNIVVGQPSAALNGTTFITNVSCNGGNTGAINLTPSGGTGPYTYSWNDGVTTEDRTGLIAGSYSVTITDANSCTKTINAISVTQPPIINGTASITHIACYGESTGAINFTPSGGASPYTYSWNDGPTTEDRTGLPAGGYNLVVTDANGCTKPFAFTINQSSFALGGTTVINNVSCNGGSNGSIDLTPTGGTPGYTYNWSDGPTTQDRTGLVAGTYAVTIRDANNCSFTISNITIGQPTTALNLLTGGGQTDVSCKGGGNGTATVAPTGGTPGYTYSWSTTPVQTTATATGLIAGTYTVTVTDANNCQATRSFTIGEPASALSALTGGGKTDVSCRGGSNGSATVAPTGGTPGYTYSWAPSGGTAATATGLAAGVYTVTVTDANGCQAFRTFAINQPASVLSAATGGGQTNVSCYGGANGTATVVPTGGTPSYTYSWNTTPVQTTATATGLAAGTYTVTVTDSNACQTTRSYTIAEPTAPLSALTGGGKTDVSCNGGSNGTATVAPTGGTPSYTYSWNTNPVQTTATATGLAAGTYTVTVTDANNCQTTRSYTISEPAILDATTSSTDVLCNGSATGKATVNPSGGSGTYTYLWSPSGGTANEATGLAAGNYSCIITDSNGCNITKNFTINQPSALGATTSQINATCSTGGQATVTPFGGVGGYSYLWSQGSTTQTVTDLAAGNYSCVITDTNGCSITKNFTINTTNTLVAASAQVNVKCNGDNTGSATVIPSGASGPFTYAWSPSGGNSDTANNLTAGSYSVTITASNGCSIVKNFTITEPPAIVITKTSQTDVTCPGGSNGSLAVNVTGGTGAYSYSWAPYGGTNATATGLTAGTYTLTVTDANQCTKTQNFTIIQPNAITTSISKTDVSCNGGSNGSATVSVTGGTGSYTYLWSPTGGTAATATGLTAGNYTVTIKDANLCQTTATVLIQEPALLTATISKTDVLCNQANNGTATVTPSGGTGNYTYSWSPSGGTLATATGLGPDTYTVTITDANGCFITKTIVITEPSALSATDSHTNATCNGSNNGTATVVASGGTGSYTYSWAPYGGTAATATGLAAGTYIATVTDANGCTITKTVQITEPSALSVTDSHTNVSCNGGSNGTATVVASGGTGGYTYLWAPSGGTAATATGLIAGTYTVTVTDTNGCFITKTIIITEPSALSVTDSHTNVSCNGGSNGTANVVVSGGTGSYTYLWAPSGGTAATATGLTAGTYTVTVTDQNLCSSTNTIIITEPAILSLTTSSVNVSCLNGNNGSATVNATGGTTPYSYSWSPSGGAAATATGLTAGSYTVTVTDANSCTATATVEISQPANPVTLNTLAVSGVTVNGASLSGTASSNGINSDKGECLTEVGFVYAQHANPTTADTKINVTAALGTFTNTLSGLRGNRTYYVRTYAVNSNGVINYGNEVSFTTQKYTLTITATAGRTKVYGTADPVFNYTALGFANGDTNSIITGLLTRDSGENVGKYNIKLGTINAGSDYIIVFTGAEFEIIKANQTITWNQTLEFGCSTSNTVNLTATADSGLPISYTIANTALGTISGTTLTISGSGNTTVTALQNGDQNHNPAIAVVKPIEISQSGLVVQQWANTLFFDNRSNNFVAWQWYKNGAAVSGATRQYYSEIQPLNGSYYVIAKDKNGNSIKSCPIEATGIVFTKQIKIYPNPVKPGGEFTLECGFSESQLNGSEVFIYDITGKLVQTISNVKPINQIIAPSQTALYIVVLKLADGQLKTINLLVK
ncbi:MAG: T9SS type A sorting domain-containing protein [Flavobacterium sp.]|uniref:MBG domain-containing protein n=1 Tax=Flavobacterium sp. TaxID=239 RepID=UPI001B1EFD19|nr:MBG domain-containing protein [Flavobacterium sp.]MBO9584289.1 T9SS type A sorting domain-containing protein [Flavobacterium sp.]